MFQTVIIVLLQEQYILVMSFGSQVEVRNKNCRKHLICMLSACMTVLIVSENEKYSSSCNEGIIWSAA